MAENMLRQDAHHPLTGAVLVCKLVAALHLLITGLLPDLPHLGADTDPETTTLTMTSTLTALVVTSVRLHQALLVTPAIDPLSTAGWKILLLH